MEGGRADMKEGKKWVAEREKATMRRKTEKEKAREAGSLTVSLSELNKVLLFFKNLRESD